MLTSILPVVKPFVKNLCDAWLFPLIKSFEDKIGAGAVTTLIEGITADLEKEVDTVLT